MVEITIIGAGELPQSTTSIASAISRGDLVSSSEEETIPDGLRHCRGQEPHDGSKILQNDIGRYKVDCIRGGISEFEGELLEVIPISNDVRERSYSDSTL